MLAELEETHSPSHFDKEMLEKFIAERMDEIYKLSISGADDDGKMVLVGIEFEARKLHDAWKKLQAN
jgi:hypothetical protein